MRPFLIFCICLAMTACVASRPDPWVLETTEKSIQSAEAAGGDEFAPVEMRFAREKLASAKLAMKNKNMKLSFTWRKRRKSMRS